ncbi:MAG: hypothetical protein M5R36_15900 [Deltaproteobacteria bacterium]|nr:hypothetical protein [Deltaproteobacteria bacterium]
MIVLDADLRVVDRIYVGHLVRQLAFDAGRRRLLAGHYLAGVISEIDPDAARVVRRVRFGPRTAFFRTVDVVVGSDERWYVGDRTGAWRLDP